MIEVWHPAPGWPRYEVSSLGNVRRIGGGRLKPIPTKVGYLRVHLTGRGAPKKVSIHRLVCEAFHGPAPAGFPDALHGPLGRTTNTPENLRWGNDALNYADRSLHGERDLSDYCHRPGSGHRFAKLTDGNVASIRALAGLLSQRKIAARYGISQGHVSEIISRRKWSKS